MRILITSLFLLLSLLSIGQSKYSKKAQKLYEKQKYEKCIEKSKKYLKKEKRSADIQQYITLSYLALYEQAPFKKKSSILKKALLSWKRQSKYNKEANNYADTEAELRRAILTDLESAEDKQRLKSYYHHQLAEVFHDTTDFYRSLYSLSKLNPVQRDIGPVFDSVIITNKQRRTLLEEAKKLVGTPYKYGGTSLKGFDCSGFTQYVYKTIGIDLPHNANLQSKMGAKVSLEEAQAGDLIFFGSKRASHAGMIYQNNNGEIELIHCASRGVTYQDHKDLNTIYWLEKILVIKRLIHEEE